MVSQQSPSLHTVTAPPFWHSGRTVTGDMYRLLVALVPAALLGVFRFGYDAVTVLALAGLTAVITEALIQRLMDQSPSAHDFTALADGILLAFLLPATAPWWLVVVGSAVTIILGRMVFGGFGGSPVCAPAVGWCVLTVSWPGYMDLNGMLLRWDLVEPLSELKYFGVEAISGISLSSLVFGQNLGALGASQTGLVLAAGVALLCMGQIRWYIPISYLAGVFGTALIYWLIDPQLYAAPLFHLLAGTTIFTAFFLLPYPSASPVFRIPMILFGLMAGALTILIRVYGIYPDGTPFAVLLANLCTPLLDLIQPKPFGGR
ncbi:electron transport complex subunit D [Thermodesulfomicrobium sp. WS]|uniref:RnfABCDGE type electron transport complex subunit D n=1 Tax=Thermodesulfomicrobium sp. WS TaxID=3004129 RepID=UPI002491E306|nr:RnfABCDGE type electron transport complex subunit D [Thermodesulfomicrobium sp. WS]BDV00964.1 electron transport complex subunit D [Thermodesulfomicrobium sp. WS]